MLFSEYLESIPFVKKILDNPHSYGNLLVLADYLEDLNKSEYSELINAIRIAIEYSTNYQDENFSNEMIKVMRDLSDNLYKKHNIIVNNNKIKYDRDWYLLNGFEIRKINGRNSKSINIDDIKDSYLILAIIYCILDSNLFRKSNVVGIKNPPLLNQRLTKKYQKEKEKFLSNDTDRTFRSWNKDFLFKLGVIEDLISSVLRMRRNLRSRRDLQVYADSNFLEDSFISSAQKHLKLYDSPFLESLPERLDIINRNLDSLGISNSNAYNVFHNVATNIRRFLNK